MSRNKRLERSMEKIKASMPDVTSFCRKKLTKTKNGQAKVCLMSDLHIGSIFCNFEAVKKLVKKCYDENIYVILGGDMIEAATRYSVGAGVYEQALNPDEQLGMLLDFFKPLFDKKLIISVMLGNHEFRFKKEVGIDICSILSTTYGVPYLGSGGYNYLIVGDQSYSIYFEHGAGGSRLTHTKMRKVVESSKHIDDFDVFAWGHVHDLVHWTEISFGLDSNKKKKEIREKYYLITGHYLNYDGSYAKANSMRPAPQGSPILSLHSKMKKIDIGYFKTGEI